MSFCYSLLSYYAKAPIIVHEFVI